jgi:hypothetical protein
MGSEGETTNSIIKTLSLRHTEDEEEEENGRKVKKGEKKK